LLELKSAREQKRLAALIPATTPNTRTGNPYAVVQVRVFDNPAWADRVHLVAALEGNAPKEVLTDYNAHVLAKYVYASTFAPGEYGTLGATPSTPGYEQLFATTSSSPRPATP